MRMMASQFTSLAIVYSIVYSGVDQWKHQSSASLAFVRGIHRRPVNSLPSVTGEFPAQRASNAENVSIWWRHHGKRGTHHQKTAKINNYVRMAHWWHRVSGINVAHQINLNAVRNRLKSNSQSPPALPNFNAYRLWVRLNYWSRATDTIYEFKQISHSHKWISHDWM